MQDQDYQLNYLLMYITLQVEFIACMEALENKHKKYGMGWGLSELITSKFDMS